jgi:hypothetical protein
MGQLKGDGKATDQAVPDATAVTFGELYRLNGWNCIASENVTAQTPGPVISWEISSERIWYVKIPAIAAAKGDYLFWATGAGFKKASTDLVISGTGGATGPACKVEEAIDANGYAGVRVLNVA